MRKQGAKSLVFDLRNNGGGSVTEAVSIINMFLPKGKTVLEMKGKLQRSNHVYKTTVEPIDSVMPMVVLVNENSASASEIMSGSLQDYDRAVILGTRTYGKGLVQTTMDLPYNGQVNSLLLNISFLAVDAFRHSTISTIRVVMWSMFPTLLPRCSIPQVVEK